MATLLHDSHIEETVILTVIAERKVKIKNIFKISLSFCMLFTCMFFYFLGSIQIAFVLMILLLGSLFFPFFYFHSISKYAQMGELYINDQIILYKTETSKKEFKPICNQLALEHSDLKLYNKYNSKLVQNFFFFKSEDLGLDNFIKIKTMDQEVDFNVLLTYDFEKDKLLKVLKQLNKVYSN